jgi:hypothetical protein
MDTITRKFYWDLLSENLKEAQEDT